MAGICNSHAAGSTHGRRSAAAAPSSHAFTRLCNHARQRGVTGCHVPQSPEDRSRSAAGAGPHTGHKRRREQHVAWRLATTKLDSQHCCCVQGQEKPAQPKPRGPPQRSPAPALSVSQQSLAAHPRAARQREWEQLEQKLIAYLDKDYERLLREKAEREARKAQQGTASTAPQQKQAAARARPPPHVWEPASGQVAPASATARLHAAEASAAAATAWAATAAAREAAAAAAAERAASLPAAQQTAGAEEWEWAAAAWQAAYAALESARQACPDAPAVREAEAAVEAAAALKRAQQDWRGAGGDDAASPA